MTKKFDAATESTGDCQGGYRKPPKETQFKKGQSGNPRGRPKALESYAAIACRVINQKILIAENGLRRSISKFEAYVTQLANKAAAGNLRAGKDMTALMDRYNIRPDMDN